jgi:predicted N-formylglutamate amidohydrolase
MSKHRPFVVEPAINPSSPLLLTCEHATNLTDGLVEVSEGDLPWLQMHWGWDPGAEPLTRALAEHFQAPAVYSRFSRLVIDPNRKREAVDLVRQVTEGHPLSFNEGITEAEIERRWESLHVPFHQAVDETIQARKDRSPEPFLLMSVHTFTRSYMGQERSLEFGVLFDDFEEFAIDLEREVSQRGFESGLNVPYSGANGMMYSPYRHGIQHDIPYIELEVRQDLLDTPEKVADVAARFIAALEPALARLLRG